MRLKKCYEDIMTSRAKGKAKEPCIVRQVVVRKEVEWE